MPLMLAKPVSHTHVLVAEADGMTAEVVGEQGSEGLVIHIAIAVMVAACPTDIQLRRLIQSNGQQVGQGHVVLCVNAVEATVLAGGSEVGRPLMGGTSEVELVVGLRAARDDVAVATVEDSHLLVV